MKIDELVILGTRTPVQAETKRYPGLITAGIRLETEEKSKLPYSMTPKSRSRRGLHVSSVSSFHHVCSVASKKQQGWVRAPLKLARFSAQGLVVVSPALLVDSDLPWLLTAGEDKHLCISQDRICISSSFVWVPGRPGSELPTDPSGSARRSGSGTCCPSISSSNEERYSSFWDRAVANEGVSLRAHTKRNITTIPKPGCAAVSPGDQGNTSAGCVASCASAARLPVSTRLCAGPVMRTAFGCGAPPSHTSLMAWRG
ncbi:hypothetical protein GE09DRAFT_1083836 [Coniochaeta sp. 2T2.1]|nr:hypothetical protein GE09DRAFT_1083836 [Coniochaeta sp. 2T2.1]